MNILCRLFIENRSNILVVLRNNWAVGKHHNTLISYLANSLNEICLPVMIEFPRDCLCVCLCVCVCECCAFYPGIRRQSKHISADIFMLKWLAVLLDAMSGDIIILLSIKTPFRESKDVNYGLHLSCPLSTYELPLRALTWWGASVHLQGYIPNKQGLD